MTPAINDGLTKAQRYYRRHRDKLIVKAAIYKVKNRQHFTDLQRRQYSKSPEPFLTRNKRWAEKNKESIKLAGVAYRKRRKEEGRQPARYCSHADCTVQIAPRYTACAVHDTGRPGPRALRVREMAVERYLRESDLPLYTRWNRTIPSANPTLCGRYRPDFVWELTTHVVALEVDELQHSASSYGCDNRRTIDIFNSYNGLPLVLIRFNPDAYTIGGIFKKTALAARVKVLIKFIRKCLTVFPGTALTIHRLYFDHDTKSAASYSVDPTNPNYQEAPM